MVVKQEPAYVVDMDQEELYNAAEGALIRASSEQRDIAFFAIVTGYTEPLKQLMAAGLFHLIAPEIIAVMKAEAVALFTLRLHTGQQTIEIPITTHAPASSTP